MKKESSWWVSALNANLPRNVCITLVVVYVLYLVVSMSAVGKKLAQRTECENAQVVASTNQFGRAAKEQRRLDAEAENVCNPAHAKQAEKSASGVQQ